MSDHSISTESGSNVLTGAVIFASALLLYGALTLSTIKQPVDAATATAPVVEQVVVTAPRHVS